MPRRPVAEVRDPFQASTNKDFNFKKTGSVHQCAPAIQPAALEVRAKKRLTIFGEGLE
jgi:hypothetical protein